MENRSAGRRIHLGCGEVYLPGYVNIDLPPQHQTVMRKIKADIYADISRLNYLRRIGCCIDRILEFVMPMRNDCLRTLVGKKLLPKRNSKGFLYHLHCQFGEFFEYRLTPREFVRACRYAGFEVIASYPIAHFDGMYHLFRPRLVKFERWQFHPSVLGSFLNRVFKVVPFPHNHMHLCVLRK